VSTNDWHAAPTLSRDRRCRRQNRTSEAEERPRFRRLFLAHPPDAQVRPRPVFARSDAHFRQEKWPSKCQTGLKYAPFLFLLNGLRRSDPNSENHYRDRESDND
jgi:hypothetical protein